MLPSFPNLSFSSCAREIGGRLFERKVVQCLGFLPRYCSYCHRMIIPHLWVILIWACYAACSSLYWDDPYSRELYPPGSGCSGPVGTEVDFSEGVDLDSSKLDGGGGLNTSKLAEQLTAWGSCVPGTSKRYCPMTRRGHEMVRQGHGQGKEGFHELPLD